MLPRILHVPYVWRPEPFGGTEHYVLGLWRSLAALGIQGAVAAAGTGPARLAERDPRAEARGREPRFHPIEDGPLRPGAFRDELYGEGSAAMAAALLAVARLEGASLVHFHAYTRLASLGSARLLRETGIPYVYSFHSATTSCLRGDLLRNGTTVCDGRMDAARCSSCWLESRGVPSPVGEALAWMGLPAFPSRAGSVTGARRLAGTWSAAVREFLHGASAVVAPCAWVRDVLLCNGVAAERIVMSRHGLDSGMLSRAAVLKSGRPMGLTSPPTFVFLGRAHRLKGADLLVEAMRRLPGRTFRAVLFLVVQGEDDAREVEALKSRAAGDPRIVFETETSRERALEALAGATACIVPSRSLETGPLVVLEAFSVGAPVIGTRLGGIEELVSHEENGLLFELGDAGALAAALERVAGEEGLSARLSAGTTQPRSMDDVASEMRDVYRVFARTSDR